MRKKRILGICGVQRKTGFSSSSFLLSEALKAAEEEGAETSQIRLIDYNIIPCEACGFCLSNRHCPLFDNQADQFSLIYQKCIEADAFIFSSPVYALSLPSIWKTWIDRCDPCSDDELSYDYYNYDIVQNVKGKALKGKVAGQIAVAAGLGHEMALASLMPAFTAVKLTIVVNIGLSLVEYDSEPGVKSQPWAKDIREAKFAIDMSRALGKRVFEAIGFSAFKIDNINRTLIMHSNFQKPQILQFNLEDAEGNIVSLEAFQDKPLVMIAASQKTFQNASLWLNELSKRFNTEEHPQILYLAMIGPLPHFITKDFIKKNVLENIKNIPALFDWDLSFSNQYGLDENNNPNILLIDSSKKNIRFSKSLMYNEENLTLVNDELKKWIHEEVGMK
jgi:multimeric flavodoxin WrbA